MFALVGRGEVTPLRSLLTNEVIHVVLDDGITFSALAARLLSEVSRELATWSSGFLSLTRTRVVPIVDGEHERLALRAAADGRAFGGRGVFQIAEKRRDEASLTPLLRMPTFVMWEAFTLHQRPSEWLTIADSARAWLSRLVYSNVMPAHSENTLAPTEPAQEYVLLASFGEHTYRRAKDGSLMNSEKCSTPLPADQGLRGIELGNSYNLGATPNGFGAAHSVGVDRLVGVMVRKRPRNLLDWDRGPLGIAGACLRSQVDASTAQKLVDGPRLIVLADGAHETELRSAVQSRPRITFITTRDIGWKG